MMKAISLFLSILVVSALGTLPSQAASKSWQGGPFSPQWSNPENWDPPGAPQDGDELNFGSGSFVTQTMVNDLPNLIVQSLEFPSGNWRLDGNELGLRRIISISGDGLVEINCAIRGEGLATILFQALSTLPSDSSDLRLNGAINLNGHSLVIVARSDATVDLTGTISGDGSIRISAALLDYFSETGEVKFSGTSANTFTGSVTLGSATATYNLSHRGAKLVLDKQSAIAIPGALVADTNCTIKLNRPNQIADTAAVSLGAGTWLLLQGHTESIGSLHMAGSYTGLHGYNLDVGESVVDTGGATLSVQGNI